MMRKIMAGVLSMMVISAITGCNGKKKNDIQHPLADTTEIGSQVPDTTIYGVCGEETAMHTLELITLQGDTIYFAMDIDEPATVHGGLLVGDKLAVISHKNEDKENVATSVINITTLLGKWTSIDKNFDIQEDGTVKSNISAESKAWTSWKLYNGQLLLNTDTFDIHTLGADSLYLENKEGIFTYVRQK